MSLGSHDYVDWCEEIGIPFGCQTNLVIDDFGVIGLATLRSRHDGRTTSAQRLVFKQAAAATQRATRLQEKLEGQQAQLLAHTSTAEALLQSGSVRKTGKTIDAAGKPCSLRRMIDELVIDGGRAHMRTQLASGAGQPSLMIERFRLREREWSLGKLPHIILIANSPPGATARE